MADTHHVIEYDCECPSCGGTGLYVGMGERHGYAVVCHFCKGTGKIHQVHEYDDFTGLKRRDNVRRVVQCNPGIRLGGTEINFGGMSYEDWLANDKFPEGSEMRGYVCPAWWYQALDDRRKPHWEECVHWGAFSGCPYFPNKVACWARFDKEA